MHFKDSKWTIEVRLLCQTLYCPQSLILYEHINLWQCTKKWIHKVCGTVSNVLDILLLLRPICICVNIFKR